MYPLSKLDQPPLSDSEAVALARSPENTDAIWRSITVLPQKWAEYSREASFREALDQVYTCLGDRAGEILQQLATVVFKPEAFAGRRVLDGLSFLRNHRFRPIYWTRLRYTPLRSREVWRFQWNVATLDRLALWDLISAQGDAVQVVLADETPNPSVPATVRLRGLKGSAIPGLRSKSLRNACSGPNRILTMVHAADEPIDIVRELGIFYIDPQQRHDWLAQVATSLTAQRRGLRSTVADVYAEYPHVDFDLEAALGRIRRFVSRRGLNANLVAELEAAARTGGYLRWREWIEMVGPIAHELDAWDLITIGTTLAQHDEPGVTCTIDDDGRPEWLAGQGRMEWRG